ncbi:hypothetical protein GUITHDRAFT_120407 [Guillardia theta CCMP2712]|uniref:EGF-like domain-containing protein n=1 Tax=Guillardia theta (strain CCMP2712) TaxID=905079 RepID=L1IB09_GUITC|nr:hypothetical protein GUITHDRAFT_120407 [Guillardia theta CCMP2712]EKX33403.1 hypothetical protein GUITHDRAFT_120407 [Guillardia theta CCMP2712]|eukprot:XP_005820383.1 hypothetical protein GUITHDRAFT_120407 [Guillardia theta CCMP2712]
MGESSSMLASSANMTRAKSAVWRGVAQDAEADLDVKTGCLVLDGKSMHEFGSELPFLHVSMAHCMEEVDRSGGQVKLMTRLDGEDLRSYDFQPQPLLITLPLLLAGPHEFAVSLRAMEEDGSMRDEDAIDEQFFLFFTCDFRPRLNWVFPPAGYVFKRNSQRFLRFTVDDVGDPSRCQEGSTSCSGYEPMAYHVSYYVNGEKMGERMRSVYFLGLSFLPDGHHTAYVEVSDKHNQPLGINHSVSFSIASDEEYLEDGEMAEVETPCPETRCPNDCGEMGRRSESHCVCAPDWTGERCEHHLLSHLAYLPTSDPHMAGDRCVKSKVWEEMAEELRVRLEQLQHATDHRQCRNSSRISVVRIRGTNGHTGFASFVEQVENLAIDAPDASPVRNPTAIQDRWSTGGSFPQRHDALQQEDLSCYFQPLFSVLKTSAGMIAQR